MSLGLSLSVVPLVADMGVSGALGRQKPMVIDRSLQSVVGLGAVSGYGWGVPALVDGVSSGKSAVRLIESAPPLPPDSPVWAARVPDGGQPNDGPTRFSRAVRHVAREAINDARARGWNPGNEVGLVLAITNGDWELFGRAHKWVEGDPDPDFTYILPSTLVAAIMKEFGMHGPSLTVGAMCATGSAAMLVASDWIKLGRVTDVLVVSADVAASHQHLEWFSRVGVSFYYRSPSEMCKPFHPDGRGFSQGEGAAAVVLTGRSCGKAYLHMLGGASTSDGLSWVAIDKTFADVLRCVDLALSQAGVAHSDVAVYSSHGTGTRACSFAEIAVLERSLTSAEAIIIKPLTGHCHPASSLMETVLAAISYETGELLAAPAAPGSHERLRDGSGPWAPDIMLKMAIGMGGHNVALVFEPPDV